MSAMFDFITGKRRGKVAELEASVEYTSGYLGVEIEENAKLRAENERLMAVLRWYADFENWLEDAPGWSDEGGLARAALASPVA